MKKTIIYMTDSILDERIANVCRKQLLKISGDNPIISVSQKPLELGHNICVGEIGRSWMNIYVQQLAGLREAKTEFIAIAEHDVLYTEEHFNWIPPDDKTFFYNDNCWLVSWGNPTHPEHDGMYSRWSRNRKALSQLICKRTLLIESVEERLKLLEGGLREMRKLGEPGAFTPDIVKAAQLAVSGRHCHLSGLLDHHLTTYKSDVFNTVIPNLDIRHSTNFTGTRRGGNRTFDLKPWGKFKDIMDNIN